MKRLTKPEIKNKADKLYREYVSACGARNARDVIYEAYKLVRAELDRRKKL